MSEAIGEGFRANLAFLIDHFSGASEEVKVLKVAEEFGEATEAYIGLYGLNPRKGVTHDAAEVADELADVAITALIAMSSFTSDPIQRLTIRMREVAARAALVEPKKET